MKPIKIGQNSELVKSVQMFLRGQGLYLKLIDGKFGSETERAVKVYQKSENLLDDGVIGNSTLGRMLEDGFALLQPVANEGTGKSDFPICPVKLNFTGNAALAKEYGKFSFKRDPNGSSKEDIIITDNWEDKNIINVYVPELKEIGLDKDGYIRFHVKGAARLQKLFSTWKKQGLLSKLLTYDGGFYPRYIRGSQTNLSNHAWGTALDFNAEWNGLAKVPAKQGKIGCMYDLVPAMYECGFYWGGHFSRPDGMHIQLN